MTKQYFQLLSVEEIKNNILQNNIEIKKYLTRKYPKTKKISFTPPYHKSYSLPQRLLCTRYFDKLAYYLAPFSLLSYIDIQKLLTKKVYYEKDLIKTLKLRP